MLCPAGVLLELLQCVCVCVCFPLLAYVFSHYISPSSLCFFFLLSSFFLFSPLFSSPSFLSYLLPPAPRGTQSACHGKGVATGRHGFSVLVSPRGASSVFDHESYPLLTHPPQPPQRKREDACPPAPLSPGANSNAAPNVSHFSVWLDSLLYEHALQCYETRSRSSKRVVLTNPFKDHRQPGDSR